jgi:hypothetical protein
MKTATVSIRCRSTGGGPSTPCARRPGTPSGPPAHLRYVSSSRSRSHPTNPYLPARRPTGNHSANTSRAVPPPTPATRRHQHQHQQTAARPARGGRDGASPAVRCAAAAPTSPPRWCHTAGPGLVYAAHCCREGRTRDGEEPGGWCLRLLSAGPVGRNGAPPTCI